MTWGVVSEIISKFMLKDSCCFCFFIFMVALVYSTIIKASVTVHKSGSFGRPTSLNWKQDIIYLFFACILSILAVCCWCLRACKWEGKRDVSVVFKSNEMYRKINKFCLPCVLWSGCYKYHGINRNDYMRMVWCFTLLSRSSFIFPRQREKKKKYKNKI